MSGLDELISRLEKATGPNFALELDIHTAIMPPLPGGYVHPPNYTASLDSAVALAERLLPGWRNSSIKTGDNQYAAYVWEHVETRSAEAFVEGVTSSRAIALCIAVLKALREGRS